MTKKLWPVWIVASLCKRTYVSIT